MKKGYKVGAEVFYKGFVEIYVIVACNGDSSNTKETKELLKKWDYLITQKDNHGLIQVKANLIKMI